MRFSVKTLLLGTVLYSIDHNFKKKKKRKNELVTKMTSKVLPEITITRLYTVKPETIELPVTSEPRRTFFPYNNALPAAGKSSAKPNTFCSNAKNWNFLNKKKSVWFCWWQEGRRWEGLVVMVGVGVGRGLNIAKMV